MRIPADLLPQKAVAQDLCVSIVTLWRARNSGIPNFPEPVIRKNMVFWRKSDLDKLEDALMKFQGRTEFEQRRNHTRRVAALTKAAPRLRRIKRTRQPDDRQRDLF